MSDGGSVVVIVLDTTRATALKAADTPNLDAIASEARTFGNARANAAWTLPSHATLLTGVPPSVHDTHAGSQLFSDHVRSLASVFRDAGYTTACVSNNVWLNDEFGFDRGFDVFEKTWHHDGPDLRSELLDKSLSESLRVLVRLLRQEPAGTTRNALLQAYHALLGDRRDKGARVTNEFIRHWLSGSESNSPFFLFVNYFEPHLEYDPPREYVEPYLPEGVDYETATNIPQDAWGYLVGDIELDERDFESLHALHLGEITYLDEQIGELRETLAANGEWDDTTVVVTADHGENIGEHDLMDHQYCLYDTLVSVPLLIRGPRFDADNDSRLVQHTDVAPTLVDAVGIDCPEFHEQTTGKSLLRDGSRSVAVSEYLTPQPSMASLSEQYGPLSDEVREQYDRSLRAVFQNGLKLIRGDDGSVELYDIRDDPKERDDLSAARPEDVDQLESVLDDWLDELDRPTTTADTTVAESTESRLEKLGYL